MELSYASEAWFWADEETTLNPSRQTRRSDLYLLFGIQQSVCSSASP